MVHIYKEKRKRKAEVRIKEIQESNRGLRGANFQECRTHIVLI